MRPEHVHPDRHTLNNEVHARPYERMPSPALVTHIAVLADPDNPGAERAHLIDLCRSEHLPIPADDANHLSAEFSGFRLRWERHTEFTTYTFHRPATHSAAPDDPFEENALQAVPRDWLEHMPGRMLVGIHLALHDRDEHDDDAVMQERLARVFVDESLMGSRILDGLGRCYTDLRIHPDGFSRILLLASGVSARRLGRTVQRLLEIETYRMMALLTLPLAREVGAQLARAEQALAALTANFGVAPKEREPVLLDELTRLAGQVEGLIARTQFRLSAATAYHEIVERRIAELREQPIPGLQTVGEFMGRRLTPAMQTCAWITRRLHSLSERIMRASNLLLTRVEFESEKQTKELLAAMGRRQKLQLQLQAAVEGLSVAAISYYIVGLVGYLAKGLKGAGVKVDPDIAVGVAVPIVVAALAFAVSRLHRRVAATIGRH